MAFPKLSTLIGGTAISLAALGANAKDALAQNLAPAGPSCDPKKSCIIADDFAYNRSKYPTQPVDVYQFESLDDQHGERVGTFKIPRKGPAADVFKAQRKLMKGEVEQPVLAEGYLGLKLPPHHTARYHKYVTDLARKGGTNLFARDSTFDIDGDGRKDHVYLIDAKQFFDVMGQDDSATSFGRFGYLLVRRTEHKSDCPKPACVSDSRGDLVLVNRPEAKIVEVGVPSLAPPSIPGPIQWREYPVHDTTLVEAPTHYEVEGNVAAFLGLMGFKGRKDKGPGNYDVHNKLTADHPALALGGSLHLPVVKYIEGKGKQTVASVDLDVLGNVKDLHLTMRNPNDSIVERELSDYLFIDGRLYANPLTGKAGRNFGLTAGWSHSRLKNTDGVFYNPADPSLPPGIEGWIYHDVPATKTDILDIGLSVGPSYARVFGGPAIARVNNDVFTGSMGWLFGGDVDFKEFSKLDIRARGRVYAGFKGSQTMPSPNGNGEELTPTMKGYWLSVDGTPLAHIIPEVGDNIYMTAGVHGDTKNETIKATRTIPYAGVGLNIAF